MDGYGSYSERRPSRRRRLRRAFRWLAGIVGLTVGVLTCWVSAPMLDAPTWSGGAIPIGVLVILIIAGSAAAAAVLGVSLAGWGAEWWLYGRHEARQGKPTQV